MNNGSGITLDNFSPGIRTDLDPSLLPMGAASACANVIMDTGTLRVRPGREVAFTAPAGPVRAMTELHTNSGTLLYAVVDDGVQYYGPGPGDTSGTTIAATDTEFGQAFIGCGRAYFDGFKDGSGISAAISFKATRSGTISFLSFPWRFSVGYGAGNGGSYTVALRENLVSDNTPAATVVAQLSDVIMRDQMSGTDGPVRLPFSATLVAGQIYHLVIQNTSAAPSTNYGSLCTVMDQVSPWNDWATSGTDARLLHCEGGVWRPWGSVNNEWNTSGGHDYNGSHVALVIEWSGSDGVVTGNGYQSNATESPWRLNSATAKFAERFTLTSARTLDKIGVALRKVGSPGTLHYTIATAPTADTDGTTIMTGTFSTAALVGLGPSRQVIAYHTLPSPIPLAADTPYRMAFYADGAGADDYYEQNPPYSFADDRWTGATWGGSASCAQTWDASSAAWVSHDTHDLAFSLVQRDTSDTPESEDTHIVGWHPVVYSGVDTTHPVRLQTYKQSVYLVDSANRVRKIAKGLATELKDEPTPSKAASISTGSAQLLVGPWGVGNESGIGHSVTAGTLPNTKIRNWATMTTFNAEYTGANGQNGTGQGLGVTVRQFPKKDAADAYNAIVTDADTPLTVAPCLGLEFVGTSFTADGAHARMKAYLPVAPPLKEASLLQIKFKVLASKMPVTMQVQLGKEDATPGALSIVKDVGLLGEDETGVWLTKDIDISDVPVSARGDIHYVAIYLAFASDTGFVDRVSQPAATGFFPTVKKAVTVLVDYVRADIGASSFMPKEEYDFLYAYRWGSGDDAKESPTNTVLAKRTIDDIYSLPTSLDITVTKDTVLPEPSVARLYVRGGLAGSTFIKLADIDLSGASPYSFNWNGDFSGEILPMPTYVNAPRTKASLCYAHKGRMLYAAPPPDTYKTVDGAETVVDHSNMPHDTLYLSNWDNPDRVPIEMTLETPETFGGWITIGEDGHAITGMGPWGSYLLVMKYAGVWRLEGATAQDIALVPMSTTAGCISHETVQQISDGMTVWLGRDKVWAATPQGIEPIGQAIESLLRKTTRAQQEAAFAVYDKQRNWYLLTVPSISTEGVVGGTAYGATTYVLYPLATGGFGWSVWTDQPQACAIYSEQLEQPGAHAADHADISHLNTGCTDAGEPIAYSWSSGRVTLGDAMTLKSVSEVRATVGKDLRETGETMLAGVTVALETADDASLHHDDVPVLSGSRVARWRLPLMRPTEAVTLTVSGETDTGGEITALAADVQARGGVR